MKSLLVFTLLLLTGAIGPQQSRKNVINDSMNSLQEPIFKFGVVADVQYCDCEPVNTRFYRNSLTKFQQALMAFREEEVDFILNLGDLIDSDYESFGPLLRLIDESGIKMWHCLGNHDYSVDRSDLRRVAQITGSKKGYYSFSHHGFRFIVLNGNELATYSSSSQGRKEAARLLSELSETGALNAFEWNGGMSTEQIDWLGKQLSESESAGEKVFIGCHFPVFPAGPYNLLNSEIVLETISGYEHIIAWFNGHNHEGGYGNFNLVHFITMRGMVETAASNSYAIVEVYGNKIWIKGSGREKSQILAY